MIFYMYLLLIIVLIIASIIDLKHMIIPDTVIVVGLMIGIVLLFYERFSLVNKILGLIIGFSLFMLIAIITGSMGGGDIKLMGVLGLIFGVEGVLFISLFAFIIGALISVLLIALKIKKRKDKISFGPFICLASLLYIFSGTEIIERYFEFMNFY